MKILASHSLAASLVWWVISYSERWNYCWTSHFRIIWFFHERSIHSCIKYLPNSIISLYSVSRKLSSLQATVLSFLSISLDHYESFTLQVYGRISHLRLTLAYLHRPARNNNRNIAQELWITWPLRQLYPSQPYKSYLWNHSYKPINACTCTSANFFPSPDILNSWPYTSPKSMHKPSSWIFAWFEAISFPMTTRPVFRIYIAMTLVVRYICNFSYSTRKSFTISIHFTPTCCHESTSLSESW